MYQVCCQVLFLQEALLKPSRLLLPVLIVFYIRVLVSIFLLYCIIPGTCSSLCFGWAYQGVSGKQAWKISCSETSHTWKYWSFSFRWLIAECRVLDGYFEGLLASDEAVEIFKTVQILKFSLCPVCTNLLAPLWNFVKFYSLYPQSWSFMMLYLAEDHFLFIRLIHLLSVVELEVLAGSV